jgi:hypothetical protein
MEGERMPTTNETERSTRPQQHKATAEQHKQSHNGQPAAAHRGNGAYVVPVLHVSLPESTVNIGFWSVLVGSAMFGAIDLPLAALIGAGVLIARHRRST